MKRVTVVQFVMVLITAVLMVSPASATIVTLTDTNSTALIDPESQSGMYSWLVDGNSVLYQQWFWYRVGSNPEAPISALGSPTVTQPTPDKATLVYTGTGFTIQVEYDLTGGTPGSLISDIAETIRVERVGAGSLDFHFFQYSDFDLGPSALDYVKIDPSLRFVNQIPGAGGGLIMSETVVTPKPSHAEAGAWGSTLNKLQDGVWSNLNDNLVAGLADVTWAFQWDKMISSTAPLVISKDKILGPVPEPTTVLLTGGLLLFLGRKLRRRAA
ncbi:MAG: PEP-CTERM sorting domain-containing protein [Bryobacteraceae bacterium]